MLLVEDHVRAFMPYPPAPVTNADDGPLAKLTFGVKDLFDVTGYRTGCGNPIKLAQSPVASANAPTVELLLQAGASFAGKTHTEELAWSLYGTNCHFGTPVNPAAPDRVPGGSSSGSASAVAAGLCDFALGTDTGGSVRAPASFCGIFGLRPTHGRISLKACMPLASSFDTCGFFTRDYATLAQLGSVLLGDRAPIASPQLALAKDMFARLPRPALDALTPTIEKFGPLKSDVTVYEQSPDALVDAFKILQAREAWNEHGRWFETYQPPLASSITARFLYSRTVTDEAVIEAKRLREHFRKQMASLLGEDRILITPTVHGPAPRLNDDDQALDTYRQKAMALLCVAGLAGLPQLVIPAGKIDGAPIGLSLIGPAGSDRNLIEIAKCVAA